ncbi:hypothetical protein H074_11100 [Amycolatopsis decaplanina DSM 44594]|uniref:Uncharacterized protein n=1 Tax=Amycolatopsis decaplanina DSM 44594 TaxID=1284240 RepID=M2YIV0_9PSEU|nr:hypothetical protein H074_11100 [Amycolatopsis decaplanina DSM 44594]
MAEAGQCHHFADVVEPLSGGRDQGQPPVSVASDGLGAEPCHDGDPPRLHRRLGAQAESASGGELVRLAAAGIALHRSAG